MYFPTPQKAAFLAASFLLASQAQAQCPVGVADPLNNTNWSFHAEATDYEFPGSASIGTFSINRIADPRNAGQTILALSGTMTVNAGNRIARLASTTGKVDYQCDPGTSIIRGGTMQFSDGSQGVLWQFLFSNSNYSEIYLVNEVYLNNLFLSHVLEGIAVKVENPRPCPANPLLALDNATSAPLGWSLRTESAVYDSTNGSTGIGILNFNYSSSSRSGEGALTGTTTTNVGGLSFKGTAGNNVYRLAETNGRYQVYPGCTGGTLSMMVGPYAVQYEFVFANGDRTLMFLVSTLATAPSTGGNKVISDSKGLPSVNGASYIDTRTRVDIFKGVLRKF